MTELYYVLLHNNRPAKEKLERETASEGDGDDGHDGHGDDDDDDDDDDDGEEEESRNGVCSGRGCRGNAHLGDPKRKANQSE